MRLIVRQCCTADLSHKTLDMTIHGESLMAGQQLQIVKSLWPDAWQAAEDFDVMR